MERRRERELEAANRSMAELDTILRRVTSALSSNPNDQTAMSVGAARDEPRRHSFSTMDVAQQVRRDIPDGPLLAPPVAAMKVARRVEDLRDAEESFILVNDTAAPALAESTQHRQNDIPTAVSTPRLANAEGIPSTKDAVEALPCSSYDPERYDSKDATVDATHLAHSFQSLELMHRYGVLDAETNAVITTPAQADMSTVSSILGDQSMAQADDQTHDDVHITDVVSMSRRQRPPLMPTVTRPATALRKERPLIQRALAPQKLAVDVGDCTYDTTIMSDAADMTVEQYSVASLEYLRRHGLL